MGLFFLTTRKRKSEKYNAQYFEFYDLLQKELVILPKILSLANKVNESEAFQFYLVKLANQSKQYKVSKIYKHRQSKKKAFLLEIDRYRFTKTSLESSAFSTKKNKNLTKVPIPIQDIKSVLAIKSNQFTINYSTPNK